MQPSVSFFNQIRSTEKQPMTSPHRLISSGIIHPLFASKVHVQFQRKVKLRTVVISSYHQSISSFFKGFFHSGSTAPGALPGQVKTFKGLTSQLVSSTAPGAPGSGWPYTAESEPSKAFVRTSHWAL